MARKGSKTGSTLPSSLLLLLAVAARTASSSFSLNVAGPDWDYTLKDLAPTTSQACKDAYSAPIDCDATLLGIVASMRPAFKPGPADLDRTCVSACSDSLDSWVAGVRSACNQPGDLADIAVSNTKEAPAVPVYTIGQVFQYSYKEACATDA